MKKCVIIGSSGLAKEIRTMILGYNFIGFVDSNIGENVNGEKIVGDDNWLLDYNSEIFAFIGVGHPDIRKKLAKKFQKNKNIKFPTLMHDSVIITGNVELGDGNILMPGLVLTTDIKIGDFNLINFNSTIGHDVVIGDYNVINPSSNISGNVKVGDNNLIGVGSIILERLKIEDFITIGAGSLVTKDIKNSGVYFGIPCKKIK